MINAVEKIIEFTPGLNAWYFRNAAKLKRSFCLYMHRFGLLKPYTFVQWLVTYRCNFSCPYCEATAGYPARHELTTVEGMRLIDDLSSTGVKRLFLSGGEPLTRPDIFDLMAYARDKKLRLGLASNGSLVRQYWQRLNKFDYFIYFTSIDGSPDYHDKMRGQDTFQKAIEALKLFAEHGVKTRMVNTVVHPGNIGQLPHMLETLKESGMNKWHLTQIFDVGRAANTDRYSLNASELRTLVAFVDANRKKMKIDLGESCRYLACFWGRQVGKPFFCGAGLTRCSIMPEGEVLPCQAIYDTRFSEGNIRQLPFHRIWKHGFKEIRRTKFSKECLDCEHINACQGACWAHVTKHGKCLKYSW